MSFRTSLVSILGTLKGDFERSALEARVEQALALRERGAIRNDRLSLVSFKNILQVEWIARSLHPWDRDLPPGEAERKVVLQCIEDASAAIAHLFDLVPAVDAIEVRVLDSQSRAPILAGRVERSDAESRVHLSPLMRLSALGLKLITSETKIRTQREIGLGS